MAPTPYWRARMAKASSSCGHHEEAASANLQTLSITTRKVPKTSSIAGLASQGISRPKSVRLDVSMRDNQSHATTGLGIVRSQRVRAALAPVFYAVLSVQYQSRAGTPRHEAPDEPAPKVTAYSNGPRQCSSGTRRLDVALSCSLKLLYPGAGGASGLFDCRRALYTRSMISGRCPRGSQLWSP